MGETNTNLISIFYNYFLAGKHCFFPYYVSPQSTYFESNLSA